MELQTKFIEGTNEQYSIREDGVFFSHYRKRIVHGKELKINKVKQLIVSKHTNKVSIPNKTKSVKNLIFEYFGYSFCKQCSKKLDYNTKSGICEECLKKNHKASIKKHHSSDYAIKKRKENKKKYRKNNPEGYKAMSKRALKNITEKVTKGYVCICLGIPVKDLTDELYEMHRNTLLFKRQIAKEHNISIQKL